MRRLALLLLASSFLAGCLNGGSYPQTYARAACASLFECVNNDEIDTWLNYDDVDDCESDVQSSIEDSADYDAWEEGDLEFNVDNADACIDEAAEIRNDSDCGSMNALTFLVDASTEECGEVYE